MRRFNRLRNCLAKTKVSRLLAVTFATIALQGVASAFQFNLQTSIGGDSQFDGASARLVVDINGDGIEMSAVTTSSGVISQTNWNGLTANNCIDADGDDIVIWNIPNVDFGGGLWGFDGSVFIDTANFDQGQSASWASGAPLYLLWTDGTNVYAYTNITVGTPGGNIAFFTPAAGATNTIIDVTTAVGGTSSPADYKTTIVATYSGSTGGGDDGGGDDGGGDDGGGDDGDDGTTDPVGDTIATASPLAATTLGSSSIETAGDVDFYEITVPALGEVRLALTSVSGLNAYLVDRHGNRIVRANVAISGVQTRAIDMAPGTYYLEVIAAPATSTTTGSYSVAYTLTGTKTFADEGWHYTNEWGWVYRGNSERWAFSWDGLRWIWLPADDRQWAYSDTLEEWVYSYEDTDNTLFIQGAEWGAATWGRAAKTITDTSTSKTFSLTPAGPVEQ